METVPDTTRLALAALRHLPSAALLAFDEDMRIVMAEGGALRDHGWEPAMLLGRELSDVLPESAWRQLRPHYEAALGGKPQRFDYEHPDGPSYHVEAVPMPPVPESSVTAMAVIRETTDERRAARALAESEELYRLLAEHSADVITVFGPDTTYRWVSPSVRRVLGYEPDELVGRTAYDLCHPDDVDRLREAHRTVLADREDVLMTYRQRHKDGSWRCMEVSTRVSLHPETGEVVRAVVRHQDVTDRVLAEEAVRRTETRRGAVLDTIADAVVLYRHDGAVVVRNAAAAELLGTETPRQRLGSTASVAGWVDEARGALAPGDHPAARVLRTGQAVADPLLGIRRPDGERRWLVAHAAPIAALEEDVDSDCGGVVLTLSDVTELREARDGLERSNADLRRLATVASHDLGAPLVLLRRELAEAAQAGPPEAVARPLRRAANAAARMQELIGAALTYAQVDRAEIADDEVDLADAAREALILLDTEIQKAGADVRIGPLRVALGDRVLLRQLLQNLVANGIKHGGSHVRIYAEQRFGRWVFVVEDDGPGIPPHLRHRIFGLFARGEGAATGHGIGLATAQRIIEHHRGRIWVEGAVPHGAKICWTLGTEVR